MENNKALSNRINTALAALVAILSVLTGYAAFKSSEAESNSTNLSFESQALLTEANSLYLEANQFVIYDFDRFDLYVVNEGVDNFASEYYYDQLSNEALASIDRLEGPFDDVYYNEMYLDANIAIQEGKDVAALALKENLRADQYKLSLFTIAIGLSFSGWASLILEREKLRLMFAISSGLALAFGLFQIFTIS